MTSPSKAETSTWWQRTSTRAYSRLPRKPYQEEQEETTDHTGVKNYKTSRMHCQKPEQQLKPILHRRTTPNSNKRNSNFSDTSYKHAEEAGEKKNPASLNFEKDDRKLWKLTKQLSDVENSRAKITLEENSKLLTGKQAADKFAENYANESKIPVSALKQREARREIMERTANRTAVKPMQQPLGLGELLRALKKLRPKRSPGPDGITNEMLIHLGSAAVCKLLQIYNHSWEQGVLPQTWREATMIPILKKGKDPKRQTAIDQLACPAVWRRPWKEL